MKILFFSRLFYPHIGGVEKHVLKIGKILVSQGHIVTVATENYQSLPVSDNIEGINIVRIDAGKENRGKKFKVWLELFKNVKLIFSADVVHCHDVFFWYLPFRFLFPFKKVFTTFHGYEGNSIPNRKSILMHKISEKLSFGNICVGDFLKKWYGTKPTFVTYGAVNIPKINRNTKKTKNKIIFFGRLEKETGVMEYLKAIKILKDKKININLDIYGEGDLEKTVRNYISKNKLSVGVKKYKTDIESVLRNYEYVFCSRYLGILESMANLIPVIAEYNNPIKKDYLLMSPMAKFISVAENGEEIAENLEKLVKGENKLDTKGAYDFVKDKTWENMTNIYKKLWRNN